MRVALYLGLIAVAATGAAGQRARIMTQQNAAPHPGRAALLGPGPRRPPGPRSFAPIFPLGLAGYDYGYAEPSPAVFAPPVYAPPPVYAITPERPPEPATMVIHEYQPASTSAIPTQDVEPPMFAIVLKSGTTVSASAVVAQNDALHIVDADGAHVRIPLDTVDREGTRRVNRERKLQLQLPAAR